MQGNIAPPYSWTPQEAVQKQADYFQQLSIAGCNQPTIACYTSILLLQGEAGQS